MLLGHSSQERKHNHKSQHNMWPYRQLLTARPLILLALVSEVLVTTVYQYQVDNPVGSEVQEKPESTAFSYHNGTIQNLRLAFIGDSVSRFQYLDLVLYLHTGQWPQVSDTPSPVDEHAYRDYQEYHVETSDILLEGTEVCDCFRTDSNVSRIFANRYFSEHGNYLAILTKYGVHPIHGHGDPATVFDEDRLAARLNDTLYEFVEPDWAYNWSAAIRDHVALIQPKLDFVVINAGLWRDQDLTEDVLREIRAATDEVGITAIYKTTTKAVSNSDPALLPHDAFGCEIFDHCLDLSWTSNTTADLYIDMVHFKAPVYRQINLQLMELLAGINQTALAAMGD
jgi:hypothetical protein